MPDGTLIQERDIEHVPSTRRNPIIAEIFHRLDYIERRGSGFNKILTETANLYGYTEAFAPKFRSTSTAFHVIFKNMNYGKTSMPNDIDGGIDNGIEKNTEKILNAINTNPKITQTQLVVETGLSLRTIGRELKNLRDTGFIRRVGSDRSGYWKIVK